MKRVGLLLVLAWAGCDPSAAVVPQPDAGGTNSGPEVRLSDDHVTLYTALIPPERAVVNSGPNYQLLTKSQLELASAETFVSAADITAASGSYGPFAFLWTTLPGTPGATSVPAGRFAVHGVAWTSGGDVGSTTTITATLAVFPMTWTISDPYPTPFVTIDSPPLTSDGIDGWSANTDIVDPIPMEQTDELLLLWHCQTTSTTPVTVTMVYNDQANSTWIRTSLHQ